MPPSKLRKSLKSVVAVAAISLASHSSGAVIDFSNLVGSNGASYSGSSQSGFTVTSLAGSWMEAHNFGNSKPAIFSISTLAAVTVTGTGGFTFSSVDLASGGNSSTGLFSIEGFFGGSSVFSFGGASVPSGFSTYSSPYLGTVIDSLVITINKGNTTSYNIDNIVVNSAAVPDAGGTAILLGLPLVFMGFMRKSRGSRKQA